ncbi:MAG: HAMP domain-containing sensor histidine kinase [Chryseolinea sp.]
MRIRTLYVVVITGILGYFPGYGSNTSDSLSLSHDAFLAHRLYLTDPNGAIRLATTIVSEAQASKTTYFQGYGNYLLSKAFWVKGNYRLSTEYGYKALTFLEDSPHIELWTETLLALARTFADLRSFHHAEIFLERANTLAHERRDYSLIAGVFRERSMLFLLRNQYDSALYWADKGIALHELDTDTLHTSILFSRKAAIYLAMKDYNTSMAFTKKAIAMDSLIGNKQALGIAYLQAAQIDYHLGQPERSLSFIKKSIAIMTEIGSFGTLIKGHNLLAEIYEMQKKSSLALEQMRIVSQFKDSLYSNESNGQIQEMQSSYELNKKEDTIRSLQGARQAQRVVAVYMIIGICLLVLLIFVLWRLGVLHKKAHAALSFKNLAIEHQKEEIQAQAENLQQMNVLKSKLFSVISHDLRGPIGNLQALLDLLTKQGMSPEEFRTISQKLKANLNVTQRTLENLLTWSQSQMEGMRTAQDRFDIQSLIDEACHLMEEAAHRKNITIEKVAASAIAVMADVNQVQLVIRNLIHNAIKFCNEEGMVVVSAESSESYCHIRVLDNGVGMTSSETDMILGEKHYFSKEGTQKEKGTGIGLLLCKEFVKRNGGSLTINSRPGEGTTVCFTVPLA